MEEATPLFERLALHYEAEIQIASKGHPFFKTGKIEVHLTSSSEGIPTIRFNHDGQIFKFRVPKPKPND